MLIKNIRFIIPLTDIEDIYDDNIDVFVELENGFEYTVLIGTPKNFLTLMNKNEMDFLEPGCPFIIVRKLTMEVIEKAIHAHAQDDGYWLKLNHFSGTIDSGMFDKLQEDQDKESDSCNEFKNRFLLDSSCIFKRKDSLVSKTLGFVLKSCL